MKSVYVLWLRDLKRYTRARSRFFWFDCNAVLFPCIFLALDFEE